MLPREARRGQQGGHVQKKTTSKSPGEQRPVIARIAHNRTRVTLPRRGQGLMVAQDQGNIETRDGLSNARAAEAVGKPQQAHAVHSRRILPTSA